MKSFKTRDEALKNLPKSSEAVLVYEDLATAIDSAMKLKNIIDDTGDD